MVVLFYFTAHQHTACFLYVRVVRECHPRASVVPGRSVKLVAVLDIHNRELKKFSLQFYVENVLSNRLLSK